MTREEVVVARADVKHWDKTYQLARQFFEDLTRTCVNCTYLQGNDVNYICTKYNMKPPPRIIVNGCEQHSELIPY